jgi:hypothetical protein
LRALTLAFLDGSFFFPKGFMPIGGGVFCTDDWMPWPDAFPGGLDGVQTKLPWLL